MSTTKHPEEAYTFIKYLMDQSNFMHFELSVNKVATQEMLDMLTNTEYTVSQLNGYLEAGMTLDSDPTAYVMKPMSKETKDEINKMLDNISYATLPNWPVYNIIMENMEDYVVGDADLEECYSNAVAELDEYAGMIYQ